MPQKQPTSLNFTAACDYLDLTPEELTALDEQGFLGNEHKASKQIFSQTTLDLTRLLLAIGRLHGWTWETLAWYADLVFATEVGRSILLPIPDENTPAPTLPRNWMETPYVEAVLNDLASALEDQNGPLVTLTRSLLAAAFGEGRFWADLDSLKHSALYPILSYLELNGAPIIDQHRSVARDAGPIFLGVILVFTVVAPPISEEFEALISHAQARLKTQLTLVPSTTDEQARIRREKLVAVDKLYASKAVEIHTPPDAWDFRLGIMSAQKRTITLQMKVAPDSTEEMIDNIIDLIRPFVGAYGARVIHLLYQIANDPPFWRNPVITVSTNDLLDQLGVKRDKHGFHHSKNRERLRDVLNIAHSLEIVGEFTVWENGKPVTKAFYQTVLSLIGATFDPAERGNISTAELRLKGLPKQMQIRLNFYEGIRRQDGTLGNHYILMSRLAEPKKLLKANYTGAYDLLRNYVFARYRQTKMENRTLILSRGATLENAAIKNKNASQATATLRKALARLVAEGILESYTPILPVKSNESFQVTLSEISAAELKNG